MRLIQEACLQVKIDLPDIISNQANVHGFLVGRPNVGLVNGILVPISFMTRWTSIWSKLHLYSPIIARIAASQW